MIKRLIGVIFTLVVVVVVVCAALNFGQYRSLVFTQQVGNEKREINISQHQTISDSTHVKKRKVKKSSQQATANEQRQVVETNRLVSDTMQSSAKSVNKSDM